LRASQELGSTAATGVVFDEVYQSPASDARDRRAGFLAAGPSRQAVAVMAPRATRDGHAAKSLC